MLKAWGTIRELRREVARLELLRKVDTAKSREDRERIEALKKRVGELIEANVILNRRIQIDKTD